ncbi:MAG TPA: stage III sporulation protein AB [Firmicutes bacterium]|nr:stage III sporulation protein AB [Bacillota bacterium]
MWLLLLKVVASGLIIFTTTAIGFDMAGRYRDRPQHLRQLQSALQGLATEINYGATPLPEAFATLAVTHQPPIKEMFQVAAQQLTLPGNTADIAWELGMETLLRRSALAPQDLVVVRQLGAVLGLSDRQDQQRHLLLAIQHLEREEVTAELERQQNERMWRYLGVLSGLLVVIVLV